MGMIHGKFEGGAAGDKVVEVAVDEQGRLILAPELDASSAGLTAAQLAAAALATDASVVAVRDRLPASVGAKTTASSLSVTLPSDQGQLPVFATSSGNLAPVTLASAATALAAQACKRVCLVSPAQDALITQGGLDFYLIAGVPMWIEGIGNTSALSARYVTAVGTLYIHWES